LKNLGKTIDRIIKVDPALEDKLSSIKTKWKRYPSKAMDYWKELIDFLNSDPLMGHPHRSEIKEILNPKRRPRRRHLYSFEPVNQTDKVIGIIPENIADVVRRHDRTTIEVSKLHMEANMTRNIDLIAEVSRKETLLDITSKKIWLELRDYYQLWANPANMSIKCHENFLVVVEQTQSNISPSIMGPGLVKMDPITLRQFLQFLNGMEPPQGSRPDDDKK